MKFVKLVVFCLVLSVSFGCLSTFSKGESNHVDFKIGKDGFEALMQKEFAFKKLALGTYLTKKDEVSEKGVNLTFTLDSLQNIPLPKIANYADLIAIEVKANLLHLSDYDYVNVTFTEEETIDNIQKEISLKTKRSLK